MTKLALDNYSLTEETEASLWLALSRAQNALRPPYPLAMQSLRIPRLVRTAGSFPQHVSRRFASKAYLNFLAKGHLSNGQKRRLDPGSLLIQQLKEIAYSLLHIIHIFSDARTPQRWPNSFLTVRSY